MASAHNAMIRGLNAIYLQAPNIPTTSPQTVADFLFFVATWSGWIMHHHVMEETMLFPGFEEVPGVKKGVMEANVEQHHAFLEGLEGLNTYARTTKPEDYDGKGVRATLEIFGDALRTHLADEIGTLWALDCVASEHAKKLQDVYDKCEAEAMKQSKFEVPPMVMGLCDRTYEGRDWPTMPAIADYVINYVFAWRHRGAWRFLPSDHFRRPRKLPFVEES